MAVSSADVKQQPPTIRQRLLGYRWTICALLFFATTINYIDRQVLGILAPTLQREINEDITHNNTQTRERAPR